MLLENVRQTPALCHRPTHQAPWEMGWDEWTDNKQQGLRPPAAIQPLRCQQGSGTPPPQDCFKV